MENSKCLEQAQKGVPFEMNGEVIFPAVSIAKYKDQRMACPAIYGIMQKESCNGCEIGQICYRFRGDIAALDSDVKHHMEKARGKLMSVSYTIEKDEKISY